MDGQYWKGDRTMSTNEWLLTSDFWQFLEPWHGRWYEYEIFIASCTYNIYDLENERWLLGDMIDHVGIYGSKVAEGLSAFNAGLVKLSEDIYYHKILDKSDHGGSASLNMRIMDHLMSRPLLTFLNSFFKLKSQNLAYR